MQRYLRCDFGYGYAAAPAESELAALWEQQAN
jgi:hypothetical protein